MREATKSHYKVTDAGWGRVCGYFCIHHKSWKVNMCSADRVFAKHSLWSIHFILRMHYGLGNKAQSLPQGLFCFHGKIQTLHKQRGWYNVTYISAASVIINMGQYNFSCLPNLFLFWVVWRKFYILCHFVVVQLLRHVQFFETPWTAADQTSLSITYSLSLLKLMSIKSVMPSNHLILCHPLLLLPSIFPSIRVFSNESVLLDLQL